MTETKTGNEGGVSAGQANACPQKNGSQEKIIVCPPDAALHDCEGCRIMADCKAETRARLDARKSIAPVIDSEEYVRAAALVARVRGRAA